MSPIDALIFGVVLHIGASLFVLLILVHFILPIAVRRWVEKWIRDPKVQEAFRRGLDVGRSFRDDPPS